ncbi:double zinc ribbon domain-containing protein [Nitrospira sp. M1]
MSNIQELARTLSHALLPVNCASCGAPLWGDPIPFLCQQCWDTIQPITGPKCPRCNLPFASPFALRHSPQHCCSTCRIRPPAFSQAWTLYPYQSPLKEAIGLFKYHGKISLANPIAYLITNTLKTIPPIDLIMPVPMHGTRLREREYNQSLLLAHRLSAHFDIPLNYMALIRTRATIPQTALSRHDRLKNLRRSFAVISPRSIKEKTILLVDDVFTTGTTVNECAKTLRKAGSGNVYVVTLARIL